MARRINNDNAKTRMQPSAVRRMTEAEYQEYLASLRRRDAAPAQEPAIPQALDMNSASADIPQPETFRMPPPAPRPEMRPIAPERPPVRPAQQPSWGRVTPPVRSASINPLLWLLICLICIGVLILTYAYVSDRYKTVAGFTASQSQLRTDTFYNGVIVDGIHIGGMTMDAAKKLLSTSTQAQYNQISLSINIGNLTWQITGSELPFNRDLDDVLRRAYAVGRQTSGAAGSGSFFSQKLAAISTVGSTGVYFTTKSTYDRATVKSLVDEIAASIVRSPQDAQIAAFSYSTHEFTFADEVYGVALDADELYRQVTAALDSGEYRKAITVEPQIYQPAVTKAMLEQSFGLISTFTTTTTSSNARNNNIALAAEAINGTTLEPEQEFSFNDCTGVRSVDKGYQQAGVISGGKTIEDYGGGVCQVSSTMMNAVARADLEITKRSPHAWPSTYVDRGCDATVDYPSLDFKFKNNKSTPVFLVSWYANKKITVEIYGQRLPDGQFIDLATETINTTNPPSEPKYVLNTSLPYGSSETTIKARKGYVVDTYKVYYDASGREISRDKLFRSTYKTYQETIEYNW
ncbi:MAG: VanW family protein [Eubacteriales bacterium]|nr:VanW family protein [Eubacteriales bacterium]